MVANVLLHIPNLGMGSIGQKSTFSEHGHVAYYIKRIHKTLLQTPTPLPKVKIPLSEYSHVAYQIKGNQECSNIVANILPAAPSPNDPRE